MEKTLAEKLNQYGLCSGAGSEETPLPTVHRVEKQETEEVSFPIFEHLLIICNLKG
jgi:hypothetical protein